MKFDDQTRPSRETILRFELVRALLGHEGRMNPQDLGEIFCMGKDGSLDPDPNRQWVDSPQRGVETPWELAAFRYARKIDRYSEDDLEQGGVGVSGPVYVRLGQSAYDGGRGMLVHRTCTGNTVILANEHVITGWSWTRTEIGGVPLTFGPPPEWLVRMAGWELPLYASYRPTWWVTMACNPGEPEVPKAFDTKDQARAYMEAQAGEDFLVREQPDGSLIADLTPEGSTGSLYLYGLRGYHRTEV